MGRFQPVGSSGPCSLSLVGCLDALTCLTHTYTPSCVPGATLGTSCTSVSVSSLMLETRVRQHHVFQVGILKRVQGPFQIFPKVAHAGKRIRSQGLRSPYVSLCWDGCKIPAPVTKAESDTDMQTPPEQPGRGGGSPAPGRPSVWPSVPSWKQTVPSGCAHRVPVITESTQPSGEWAGLSHAFSLGSSQPPTH